MSGSNTRAGTRGTDDADASAAAVDPLDPDPSPLFPQLKARRNASPEAVAKHQRARLHAAMIHLCSTRGYGRVTVNGLARAAGVSKKTLYRHFDNKEACFLATYDLVVRQAVGRISAAYRDEEAGRERDWAAGLCRAFDAFAQELIEQPASSRLALLDVLAVAPSAAARIERSEALFTTMIAKSFQQAPDGAAIPAEMIRPLIGGIWFVARSRLLEGNPQAISTCGPELGEWLLAYRSPACSRLPAAQLANSARLRLDERRRRAAGERARMLQAAAEIIAGGGYPALARRPVTQTASPSATVVAAEFDDVPACFLDLLGWLGGEILPAALRESEDAPSWASGICRAVDAFFSGIASDPTVVGAGFLDAFAAGPDEAERGVAIMRAFAEILTRRMPPALRPSPLVVEAVLGSVWSIARRHVVCGRERLLPVASARAAFIVLAPVLGPDAALAAIRAEYDPYPRRGRGTPLARDAARPTSPAQPAFASTAPA